jgi:hypothetical protein
LLQACQWLHEKAGCVLDLETLCNATRRGDLQWMQWVLENTPPVGSSGSLIDLVKLKRARQLAVSAPFAALFGSYTIHSLEAVLPTCLFLFFEPSNFHMQDPSSEASEGGILVEEVGHLNILRWLRVPFTFIFA